MADQYQISMSRTISFGIILFLVVLVATMAILIPPESIAYFISDDAYYYFLTAYHISIGDGATFDGINQTNGFHPQWMLIIIPLFYLTNDLDLALKAVFFTQGLVNIAAISLIFAWLKNSLNISSAVIGSLLLLLFYSPLILMFNGLESSLLLFWVSLLVYLDKKYNLLAKDASLGKRLTLGMLLAGLFTARLDTAFVLIALALVKLIWPGTNKRGIKYIFEIIVAYLPTIAIFGIFVAPYFVWNYSNFEHLTPISGAIKNTFPTIIRPNLIGNHSIPYAIPFILISGYLVYSLFRKRGYLHDEIIARLNTNQTNMMFFAVTIGCIIHLLWTRFFMLFGTYQWHFVMYIVPIVYFIVLIIDKIVLSLPLYTNKLRALALMVVTLGAVSYNLFLFYEKGDHHKFRLQAAEWTSKNIPSDAGIALSDAGVFAYFNSRQTMNIDGLINGYKFQEAIVKDSLLNQLEAQNIHYMADAYTKCDRESHSVFIYGWRGKNYPESVGYKFTFFRSDAVYTSTPISYRPLTKNKKICFVIWNIKDAKVTRI
jgi:hypothetical protein